MVGARVFAQGLVLVEDLQHALRPPARTAVLVIGHRDGQEMDANVTGGAPGMSDILRPFPGFVGAPFADAEEDGPPGAAEGAAHRGVGPDRIEILRVAPVIFEVVYLPGGIGEGILVFVAIAAGIAGAGIGAGIAVDAQFEAARVEIIRQRLDAGGEFLLVLVDEALLIPLAVPAVVQVEINITGINQPQFDHLVGRGFDQFFVDIGGELVPGIPSHLRGEGESFPFRERGVRAALLRKNGAAHQAEQRGGKENLFHYRERFYSTSTTVSTPSLTRKRTLRPSKRRP